MTQAAAPGAKLAFVGRGPPDIDLPIVAITAKELEINGVFRYANWWVAESRHRQALYGTSSLLPVVKTNTIYEQLSRSS